ncbi:MAG: error-prone DNA polymerase [Rhodothalassiaceae bacterium]
MRYAELQVTSNFSFLRGGAHPDELVLAANVLGLHAIALTDRNSFAGLVRAHQAAKQHGVRFVPGVRLDLLDGLAVLAWPRARAGYGALSKLISLGQRRADKGDCHLHLADLAAADPDACFALVPPDQIEADLPHMLQQLRNTLTGPVFLAAACRLDGQDRARLARLDEIARAAGTPLLASNDVLYHDPARRPLTDVLTCIREGVALTEAGWRLQKNAERHLKTPAEMAKLFKGYEHALDATLQIVSQCRFSLDELRYDYPEEPVPEGETPQSQLVKLSWQGARTRFPDGIPQTVSSVLGHELALVEQLNYAPYFLTVHDIVSFARSRGILCQGRGSAANSVICYCLGITAVNPTEIDLLFERFISAERNEPPDIDVDFEHSRREEVIQYIYARYGRAHAGIAATVISYRPRSAVREVGKVMGLSEDVTAALAGTVWGQWGQAVDPAQVREAGLDPNDPHLKQTLELTHQLLGFPRHLSQHAGGFVLTRTPLDEIVPIANAAMPDRTFVEWDKDDLDALGILKIDVLALGMLSCIRGCFDLLAAQYDRPLSLASVPREDPAVYDMLCAADSIGVFQVESRAQMNMLPRLKPRCFYDLVIEVAIVRPGPIQGDMVHPYLKRRDGLEQAAYPAPGPEHGPPDELERVLKKTLGVPLFQEQAMRIAIVAAHFSPGEADQLRRAMATFRKVGTIHTFQQKMIEGMVARGYDPDFATRCFKQIEGFGEYGFPESHAASFALLVYVSAWLKCHYPAAFCAAILNAQPMGFYAPAQLVRDACDDGVVVRGPDLMRSDWDCTLEPCAKSQGGFAVRLGLRQIKGLTEAEARQLLAVKSSVAAPAAPAGVQRGGTSPLPDPETSAAALDQLKRLSGVSVAALERLAEADALRGLGLERRQALWAVKGLAKSPALPLFAAADAAECVQEAKAALPPLLPAEAVVEDYQSLRLSLRAHPLSFLRPILAELGVTCANRVRTAAHGSPITAAGIVLVRQRPGSAKGVVFLTMEDETGVVNAVFWPKLVERFRKEIMGSRLALIRGRIERSEDIVHLMATRVEDRSDLLLMLSEQAEHLALPPFRCDEIRNPLVPLPPGEITTERAASGRLAHPRDPAMAARIRDGLLKRLPVQRHPREARDLVPRSRDFH